MEIRTKQKACLVQRSETAVSDYGGESSGSMRESGGVKLSASEGEVCFRFECMLCNRHEVGW